MSSPSPTVVSANPNDSRALLAEIIGHIGHVLPAQGPISVFIHHNPLHAFEHLPFEEAVERAAQTFGCEPFLTEDRYREELRRGRIEEADIDAVLASELGARSEATLAGGLSRQQLWRRVLVFGFPELTGAALAWTLAETKALAEFRRDLPGGGSFDVGRGERHADEPRNVRALWSACRGAVRRAASPPHPPVQRFVRSRDLLHATDSIDVDEWVHPLLIRATNAYLDQGLADWPMPGRERGLFACFLALYRSRLARLCQPFGRELHALVREQVDRGHDAWASLEWSMTQLGIPVSEWEAFLAAETLALRGFAGMVHQFERRPDRVPAFALPATLVDFLATRLVLVRAGLEHAAGRVGFTGHPSAFRAWLQARLPESAASSIDDRSWRLFQLAQLAGLSTPQIDALDAVAVGSLEEELRELEGPTRRRLFHHAYERHLRHRFFDAVAGRPPGPDRRPAYQAIFCIDEREESIRRHLEEVDADIETFGSAGFYGVAMYYRGATDAHARPLCPVAIEPRHFVAEVERRQPHSAGERLRRGWSRVGALLDKNIHLGGRRARRGALLFATMGVLWVLPLVLRVVFPWLSRSVARAYERLAPRPGRLALEHDASAARPPIGEQAGFTTLEMAEIVLSQLSAIGIRDRFAPLVLVFGHRSTSLNNPHESAHDCGACGGGRGGPNARAFAQMANNPAVRDLVADRGLQIPTQTWFIAGERDTANNDIHFFDVDLAPDRVRAIYRRAQASLEVARRREAQERCRRFASAPLWLSPTAALFHVQARATDLAQPRPEYGHATNAVCFVGPRRRTRGLFLDRRAFLVSYDPEGDPSGASLAKLLAAVTPVVAGISLEYLFGSIDPVGYGSGTKLPHNVAGLVGVMDGAESDLRTGLPWQMLEVHEPVRLSIVVEVQVSVLRRIVDEDPELRQLVGGGWIFLAALDPSSATLVELDGRSRPYAPGRAQPVTRGGSHRHYEGRRGHLPFATIEPYDGAAR